LKPRRYGFDDTEAPYREWRYEWGVGAVHDVDQIEWRGNKPLCVIELTRVKHDMTRTEHAVRDRLWRQFSGRKLRCIARNLGVPFVVVIYDDTLEELSVCLLDAENAPFHRLSKSSYQSWLSRWQPGSPPPSFSSESSMPVTTTPSA